MMPHRAYVDLPTRYRQHVSRDPEVLDGSGEREAIRRNDADVPLDSTKPAAPRFFGVAIEFRTLVKIRNSRATRMS